MQYLVLAMALPTLASSAANHQGQGDCRPQHHMEFVCGPENAEDLVQIPDSKWIVTTGMGSEHRPGQLYLLDSAERSVETLYPGNSPRAELDHRMFGNCPAPPDLANFSAHGLALLARKNRVHQLFVASHGGRESVEVFDLDARGQKPIAKWVGCVVLPHEASVNSVAPLPAGGFVLTRLLDNSSRTATEDLFAGKITGFVYLWHPGTAPKALPGTELSGPNGVVLSADGSQMYVAAYGSREIVRFSLQDNPVKERVVKLDFNPDNLRWSPDGKILVTGQRRRPEIKGAETIKEWVVAELEPETMNSRHLFSRPSIPGFWAATAAVAVPGGYWVGAVGADRLAFVSAPTRQRIPRD